MDLKSIARFGKKISILFLMGAVIGKVKSKKDNRTYNLLKFNLINVSFYIQNENWICSQMVCFGTKKYDFQKSAILKRLILKYGMTIIHFGLNLKL